MLNILVLRYNILRQPERHKISAYSLQVLPHFCQIARYKQCSEETSKRKSKAADVSANDSSSGDSSCGAGGGLTKADRRFNAFVAKQDQALRVSIYLLLNLAERTDVEEKMKRKGIVRMLVNLLERKCNVELLILVVSFLKKLSCYASNKVQSSSFQCVTNNGRLISLILWPNLACLPSTGWW